MHRCVYYKYISVCCVSQFRFQLIGVKNSDIRLTFSYCCIKFKKKNCFLILLSWARLFVDWQISVTNMFGCHVPPSVSQLLIDF